MLLYRQLTALAFLLILDVYVSKMLIKIQTISCPKSDCHFPNVCQMLYLFMKQSQLTKWKSGSSCFFSSLICLSSSRVKMIPPRGCAYIVMIHRQDAFRALQKLSRGSHKVNQKAIKVSEPHRLLLSKALLNKMSNQRESWEFPFWIKSCFFVYFLTDCLGFEQGHKGWV